MEDKKQLVAETAGRIWNLLAETDQLCLSELPKVLNESAQTAYQGLGWLAREDKIIYTVQGRKIFVELTSAERACAGQLVGAACR